MEQKSKLKEYLIYIGEKLMHCFIVLICLYVVFALDLPPHITYVMLKSILGENAQFLKDLRETIEEDAEESASQKNITCSSHICEHELSS